jgi:hypothetical protein
MIALEAVTVKGETSALCQSLGIARASLYRHRQPARPMGAASEPRPSPRALGPAERQAVLDVLHSERFVDQSPAESTRRALTNRRASAQRARVSHPRRRSTKSGSGAHGRGIRRRETELVATAPNQIWSWDITKLKGPIPTCITRCM